MVSLKVVEKNYSSLGFAVIFAILVAEFFLAGSSSFSASTGFSTLAVQTPDQTFTGVAPANIFYSHEPVQVTFSAVSETKGNQQFQCTINCIQQIK